MQWLIAVLALGAAAWGFYRAWTVYQERFAHRRDMEEAREMALLAELQRAKSEAPETVLVMDPPKKRKAVPAAATVEPTQAASQQRVLVLDAALRVVFFLLKIELPDHEILARVDPAAVLGEATDAPTPRCMLDIVICKRDFTPVAVVMIQRGQAEDMMRERIMALLSQRSIDVLRWHVKSLPARGTVREAVFGTAG